MPIDHEITATTASTSLPEVAWCSRIAAPIAPEWIATDHRNQVPSTSARTEPVLRDRRISHGTT